MATPRRKRPVMNHPVVITFLILAVVAAMSLAAEVLKPLALSVLLAFALTPLAGILERRMRLPRALAAALTVVMALGTLGGISYVVGGQLTNLANEMPKYRDNIERKLRLLRPSNDSAIKKATRMAGDVAESLDGGPARPEVASVRIVEQPSFRERLQGAVGPYLEFLAVGSFVLVLVLFMLVNRDDLRDRIVGLFGNSRVSLTTRALDEIGQRISRYLATFAMVNSVFGLVIGAGLWAAGIPYAVLWGCLAALLRFIPYVGPAVAFVLPLVFSFAHFEGWREPLLVLALYAVVETALNSFLEPVIYGKTTGSSALGLLVAAMFWTWLWGVLGLLLSTPLTVCLAVLGKYVPGLGFFATMLGEEAELEPDVRFYQRLVALDRDGAVEVVDAALKSRPRSEVFDGILIPALSRAERDATAGTLDDSDLAFVWRVVEEIVDELDGTPEMTLAGVAAGLAATPPPAPAADGQPQPAPAAPATLMGVSASDTADAIVLKMLAQLLEPAGLTLDVATDSPTPLALAERVQRLSPALVVLSHLPPSGLTEARYQVRRLRTRFADLPIMVSRWGAAGTSNAAERLTEVGATAVVSSLVEARDQIIARLAPASARAIAQTPQAATAAKTATAAAGV